MLWIFVQKIGLFECWIFSARAMFCFIKFMNDLKLSISNVGIHNAQFDIEKKKLVIRANLGSFCWKNGSNEKT